MGVKKIDLSSVSPEEREIIEARRAYKREWRKNNKERIEEHNRRFWEKKAAQMKTESKA